MLKKKDFELIAEAYELVCLNERVYQLSNTEQEDVLKAVKNYMNIFDPKRLKMPIVKIISLGPEKVYAKFINDKGFIAVGNIKFHDERLDEERELPVYVGFDKESKDKGTYIYQTDKEGNKIAEYILLHYYKLKYDSDVIEDAIVHELFHAKQPYKFVGKHYERSKLDYYTDPVEVHNYVSNIVKTIENAYLQSEDPSSILKFLEVFAREGKLPNLPESDIIKKIGKDEFVNYLYHNRNNPKVAKEHKKLVSKLHWLYNTLKDYENR
jgi:hypothetical protein